VIAETLTLARVDEEAANTAQDPSKCKQLRRQGRKSADRLSRVVMRQQRRMLLRAPEYYRKSTTTVDVIVCGALSRSLALSLSLYRSVVLAYC
jgi:hypothetical protein